LDKLLKMQVQPSRRLGFTVIELLVTIAIAAIVMGLAVPSFNSAIKNNRLTAEVNMFVGALNLARSEAIKRNHNVAICKSNDGATCVTAGNWEQGWLVFGDLNNNGLFEPGNGEPPLRIQENAPATITITGLAANLRDIISYKPSGMAGTTGTIKVCDDRPEIVGKTIVFVTTGRARINSSTTDPKNKCP